MATTPGRVRTHLMYRSAQRQNASILTSFALLSKTNKTIYLIVHTKTGNSSLKSLQPASGYFRTGGTLCPQPRLKAVQLSNRRQTPCLADIPLPHSAQFYTMRHPLHTVYLLTFIYNNTAVGIDRSQPTRRRPG